MNEPDTPARDVTVDVRTDRFAVLFPDDDDPRHDLVNTSWYVRHSAHLPHLGEDADHHVIAAMGKLRSDLPTTIDE